MTNIEQVKGNRHTLELQISEIEQRIKKNEADISVIEENRRQAVTKGATDKTIDDLEERLARLPTLISRDTERLRILREALDAAIENEEKEARQKEFDKLDVVRAIGERLIRDYDQQVRAIMIPTLRKLAAVNKYIGYKNHQGALNVAFPDTALRTAPDREIPARDEVREFYTALNVSVVDERGTSLIPLNPNNPPPQKIRQVLHHLGYTIRGEALSDLVSSVCLPPGLYGSESWEGVPDDLNFETAKRSWLE